MKYNYDSKYDILSIAIEDKSNSYCEDDGTGIVVSRDMDTNEVTGIMIIGVKDKIGIGVGK